MRSDLSHPLCFALGHNERLSIVVSNGSYLQSLVPLAVNLRHVQELELASLMHV
jgi:hypothetical protein